MGSSPRMRGKQYSPELKKDSPGLIPAHAGKTDDVIAHVSGGVAHPRACGENRPKSSRISKSAGSSPRMRGKRCISGSLSSGWGLIPAHAGKTLPRPPIRDRSGAHPRACGENRTLDEAPAAPTRLIPAHAGKTRGCGAGPPGGGAHPRACGENLTEQPSTWAARGSSPRMRGKLIAVRVFEGSSGLIPAHAGKTLCGVEAHLNRWAHPRACGENFVLDRLKSDR